MKNKLQLCSYLLTALMFSLVLAGCGSPTSVSTAPSVQTTSASVAVVSTPSRKTKYRIGMSQTNASKADPWRLAMNDQLAAAAAKYPELEVIFSDATASSSKQVGDVENFLQQGIDLLIISPNEAAPLTGVITKAYNQGIPVILLDRKVLGDKFTMWIGANNTLIGKKAGEYVAQWCKDNNHTPCNVIELRGLDGATPAQERGAGFKQGIGPGVKIVDSQDANWLYDKAIPVSQALFQKHSEVNVIYAHNDPMGEAGIVSARAANLDPSHLLFVAIDGLPTPDGGIKSVIAGRLNVTYVYPTGGTEAIEWAVKILEQNQQPPKEVVLGTEEVTKINAAEIYKKYGGK